MDDAPAELLRLASVHNFRDVAGEGAGYPTRDGRRMRRGVLYRANHLRLSDVDAETLASLGVRTVCDLRSQAEVEAEPDVEVPGATWVHVPVADLPHEVSASLTDSHAAVTAIRAIYREFVTDPVARTSFGTVLRRAAEGSDALVFHCAAGKDRTGWAAALVQHVVGVADDVVEADYLLTNERFRVRRAEVLEQVAEHLGADRVAAFEPLLDADLSYLDAARDAVVEHYGSLEDYVRDGLGVDEALQATLRARLVV